jgi:DNA-binding MarR family transcriptional regulator
VRQAELLRYLVLAAQREGNRRLTRELAPLGLTPAQAEVLRVLGDREPLTLTALGELLICESGKNPSRLVDRLVSAGFVSRAVSTDDRRQLVLKLTATGRVAESGVRQIEERLYAEIDAATAGLDLTVSLQLLGAMVNGQPAGDALQRRV